MRARRQCCPGRASNSVSGHHRGLVGGARSALFAAHLPCVAGAVAQDFRARYRPRPVRRMRDVPTRRSSVLLTALMLPLSVSLPSAAATSRARTSTSPTAAKCSMICSVSLP